MSQGAASPAPEDFARGWTDGRAQVVFRRLIDDLETPVSACLKLGQGEPYAFLFESVEGGAWRGRYSILTLSADLVWRCRGDRAEVARGGDIAADRFTAEPDGAVASMKRLVDEARIALPDGLPPMAAGVFGVFGYDLVRLFEPIGDANPDPLDLPDAVLTRPSIVAIFDGVAQEIILATPAWPDGGAADAAYAAAVARLDAVVERLNQPTPRPAPGAPDPVVFQASLTEAGFCAMVERAKDYIAAGDIFQVVPSQRFSTPFARAPFAFHPPLRPATRTGLGPASRTPEEDQALEAELLADPKELAEHLMLVDLGRNDVGRVAEPASVKVTKSFFVERYSHVMHLVSNVTGKARQDLHPVDILLAALPAGTLSGAPKVRAMEIIDELEPVKRGVGYAGAAGYISSGGEIDACIVLRTALFKDGVMHVQAGAGVVADSDPKAEYDETLHKSRALKAAAEEAWRFG